MFDEVHFVVNYKRLKFYIIFCMLHVPIISIIYQTITGQKLKFFIKDFISKCDQIRGLLRIWSHLLKKS